MVVLQTTSKSPLSWTNVRFGLVIVTWGIVTWNYYLFSHYLHGFRRLTPNHHEDGGDGGDGTNHTSLTAQHQQQQGDSSHTHEHGRHGSFQRIHDQWDWLFLYGLALPLVLLTLTALVWNPIPGAGGATATEGKQNTKKSHGDVNVRKWAILLFVLPLYLVMWDAAREHHMNGKILGWNLFVTVCNSLLSPSGYAATWALSLFLIPVTKHSPILDWLRVTPVQALAFHRVAGWVGFWNSLLHGFVHLRHLMSVLNPQHLRTWQEQLKILLIPSSWECIASQDPFLGIFVKDQVRIQDDAQGEQCWLALVNATGMISVIAYLLLAITSLPKVRRYSYKLFYLVHIPAAWVMIITAIWHYPTCALILIPNIIYYLSFHIPVYVMNAVGDRPHYPSPIDTKACKSSPLVEANLIPGGSIELVFATSPDDRRRYENLFVKLSHPSVSPLSHPFSAFSREALRTDGSMEDHEHQTLSMLLRSDGSFTDGLKRELFPNLNTPSLSPPFLSSSYDQIQFDSFYAGTFDWVDCAMSAHDEILLAAGGVGVVPFLEFLPLLHHRIRTGTAHAETGNRRGNVGYIPVAVNDNEGLNASLRLGPKCIHFHWFCRNVGLASHVWHTYLRRHVNAWENHESCQGRLKIHIHFTSMTAEEELTCIPNLGLVKQHVYPAQATTALEQQQVVLRPVKDAHFRQSWQLGLLLPGSLMVIGTMLHWVWYVQVILSDEFRDDNLIMRAHSIVFTLLVAMVGTILLEFWLRRHDRDDVGIPVPHSWHAQITPSGGDRSPPFVVPEAGKKEEEIPLPLFLSKGRPCLDMVLEPMVKAKRPGVYSCGSHSFVEAIEGCMRSKRKDCCLYREDSEM